MSACAIFANCATDGTAIVYLTETRHAIHEDCNRSMPRLDVAEILAGTDLFVYTPRPGEGTKDLVVMEAMAMGVPAVLSNVETTRASAVQGENHRPRSRTAEVTRHVDLISKLHAGLHHRPVEKARLDEKEHIQQAIAGANDEIRQLRGTIVELRDQLELRAAAHAEQLQNFVHEVPSICI